MHNFFIIAYDCYSLHSSLGDTTLAAARQVKHWALGCAIACVAIFSATAVARAAAGCPPVPPVVTSLDVPRFYNDDAGTIVDPLLKDLHAKAVEPLTQFLRQVVSDADHAYTRSTAKSQGEAADCALTWLQTWAAGGGWLGVMTTKQAEYQRKWDLAGVALAYLKVRPYARPDQRLIIEPWLQRFADAARGFFDNPEYKRNNHWYWLGLGEAAVGLATDSPRHFDIARNIMQDAARDIAADGTLKEEMARGSRALHYHVFAMVPLVMMAELAASRGEDWYALGEGALHRLINVSVAGIAAPAQFDKLAGIAQERPINARAGWLQVYQRHFPGRLQFPPADVADGHRWLGGNALVLMSALTLKGAQPVR